MAHQAGLGFLRSGGQRRYVKQRKTSEGEEKRDTYIQHGFESCVWAGLGFSTNRARRLPESSARNCAVSGYLEETNGPEIRAVCNIQSCAVQRDVCTTPPRGSVSRGLCGTQSRGDRGSVRTDPCGRHRKFPASRCRSSRWPHRGTRCSQRRVLRSDAEGSCRPCDRRGSSTGPGGAQRGKPRNPRSSRSSSTRCDTSCTRAPPPRVVRGRSPRPRER